MYAYCALAPPVNTSSKPTIANNTLSGCFTLPCLSLGFSTKLWLAPAATDGAAATACGSANGRAGEPTRYILTFLTPVYLGLVPNTCSRHRPASVTAKGWRVPKSSLVAFRIQFRYRHGFHECFL